MLHSPLVASMSEDIPPPHPVVLDAVPAYPVSQPLEALVIALVVVVE